MKRVLTAVAVVSLWTAVAGATTYSIDPMHSSVSFSIKHVVGKVTGHFDKFDGAFDYDAANTKSWQAAATIQAASINTGIEKRDNHLRSPDFFDASKYPTLTFKSTGVTDIQGNQAKLHGDLTMHGVTKPVVLDLEIAGAVPDPMGKGTRAGATATGKIARLDFGIGPASGPMSGMVGKDVDITIEVEGISK